MITLTFPPSCLSGHNAGHWASKVASGPFRGKRKSKVVKLFREEAWALTIKARWQVPAEGDIRLYVTFYPPDNRSDRANFSNRMKPIFDGIADALRVNDSRFVPVFHYCAPDPQNPRVEVRIGA